MSKTLLIMAMASIGLMGCGDDADAPITLSPLEPKFIEVPEQTPFTVKLTLSATPKLDDFVDIDYARHAEFINFDTTALKFTPYDEPPTKNVELTALKISGSAYMDVNFTVRSSGSSRTLKVRVISQ